MSTVERLVEILLQSRSTVATCESCTGGMIAAKLVGVSGVSDCFLGSVVAYANEVKENVVGVPKEVLETVGAVSYECAKAMCCGVRDKLGADYGISTTGIAGPGGGTAEKPVGLVYIGVAGDFGVRVEECRFQGDRLSVREQSTVKAMEMLISVLEKGE